MARIISIAILLSVFSVLGFSQGDYKQDKDFDNFKRNFDRAVAAGDKLATCDSARCVSEAERYTKYAANFLKKLESKYSSTDFEEFRTRLGEIESKLNAQDEKTVASKDAAELVRLWAFRLDPSASLVQLPVFIEEFDSGALQTAVDAVLKDTREGTSDYLQAVKLRDLLAQYEQKVVEAKVFEESGMIGSALVRAKEIQDADYLKQTLQPSLDVTEAMLRIAPSGQLLKSKRDEIAGLIANAETQAKSNKPEIKKVYKDSLPSSVWKNASLEQQFVNAIRAQRFEGITITGAILTEKDWKVTRTADLTTKYRYMEGVVTAKNAEGECWFQYFNFRQFQTGSGWGQAQRGSSGSRYYYKCE